MGVEMDAFEGLMRIALGEYSVKLVASDECSCDGSSLERLEIIPLPKL
jgi:hypothetical protein